MHKFYIRRRRGSSASQTIIRKGILLKVGVHVGRCLPSLHTYAFAANPARTKVIPGCSPKGYAEQYGKNYDASESFVLGIRLHRHMHNSA